MRIKFLRNEIYETEGPGKGPKFQKGDVVDFPDHIGQRWERRGHENLDARPSFHRLTRVPEQQPDEGDGADAASETQSTETADHGASDAREPGTDLVQIPEDWRDLHHATKRRLAREIRGEDPQSTDDAEAVIEAELERRADLPTD